MMDGYTVAWKVDGELDQSSIVRIWECLERSCRMPPPARERQILVGRRRASVPLSRRRDRARSVNRVARSTCAANPSPARASWAPYFHGAFWKAVKRLRSVERRDGG